MSFKWDDLLIDQLSEDERLIRDTARDYAQDKLLPMRVRKAHQDENFDREIMNEWVVSDYSVRLCPKSTVAPV